ncbi:AAA family ATPase [Clostridium tunisiense]|uniref:AAA family ATPase n=1 Tax=Clostridium tunisiense TaxID=219748 RepID=UPI0002E7D2DF|nr:MoxR family ATPase [Clostridium tunisiense]
MNNNLELVERIVNNVEKVIIGKRSEIYNIMKGLIADGHILIEDVPGVGKTTLIKAITKSLNLTFSRVQFTPDLLPSDIIGVSIYNAKSGEFEFRKGPIFANIILADEINRTSPKTQSALLEVMEEKQVSEGVNTYVLNRPFIVMATQNPIEYEGTFPLPEAQLDRFMIKVKIGYPSETDEVSILNIYKEEEPLDTLTAVASSEDIIELQKAVRKVHINNELNKYIISIINATRHNKSLALGGSTRASLALQRISQATALIKGRDYVIPEDIKENVKLVLSHRIIPTSSARANRNDSDAIISEVLRTIPVPKVMKHD